MPGSGLLAGQRGKELQICKLKTSNWAAAVGIKFAIFDLHFSICNSILSERCGGVPGARAATMRRSWFAIHLPHSMKGNLAMDRNTIYAGVSVVLAGLLGFTWAQGRGALSADEPKPVAGEIA